MQSNDAKGARHHSETLMENIKRSTHLPWYTFVPANFSGAGRFWDRDSGLLCRGFEMIDRQSKTILFAPSREGQGDKILRGSEEELANPEWWRNLGIEGVVMFSWARPRYQAIASAIVASGVKLVQLTDTHGVISPIADARAHLVIHWEHRWHEPAWKRLLITLASLPEAYIFRPFKDRARARLIATGNCFCGATPEAVTRFARLARFFEGSAAAKRVQLLPLPVNPAFFFSENDTKIDEVISIGRWDTQQKRTPLLTSTIELAAKARPQTTFRIFGRATDAMHAWHATLSPAIQQRVIIEGFVQNDDVAKIFRSARVILVSSAYEGCHISSAEAVCSGASVVGCKSAFLSAITWHTSRNSGRLCKQANPTELARTLVEELQAWDRNERDPIQISNDWCQIFHPDKVASRAIELAQSM
jgi:hypothetical protein